ncbi:MAG TPA: ABC transporter ATP-binding protein [Desulfitobacteriaceae bacterium]|nr:ABC transporter ATP-binding protein [Desulfitobacteriaceae bacterium]
MKQQQLLLRDIHYSYPDGFQAINGLSFSIRQGESVGIIGANGAGKSTLLMLLMGILFPSRGEILLRKMPVTKKTLPKLREKLGMVFQDPDDQLFMTTVYDDVAFGPRNYKLDETEVKLRVERSLELVGISHLYDRAPFKLSEGQKRAAAIASILSMQPEILVMDEPTAALDPKSRRKVMNLLHNIGQTKIITSHDLDMVFDLCERTIVLKNGVIAADGLTSEILADAGLMEACGLELPPALQNCPLCGSKKSGIQV